MMRPPPARRPPAGVRPAARRRAHLGCLLALPLLTGCGLAQRTAINTTYPIIDNAVAAAYRNGDVELMEQALPANIVLIEGLAETRPEDRRGLVMACRLYVSYSLGFVEQRNPARATALYDRALAYGLRAYPKLAPGGYEGTEGEARYAEQLETYDAEDVADLVWVAAAWANAIKGKLNESSALAELPRLEQLAERLVALDGSYLHGLPHVLMGSILTFRPAYLGGEPERANEEFGRAFEVADRSFLLTHLFYARYYCKQVFDEALFTAVLEELLNADPTALPDVLLLNRVAQEQGRALLDTREELF